MNCQCHDDDLLMQHQLELLNTLAANFASNEYRLLIIDSIMACFRVDYCGRGELADRQQKLNQFLSKLTHMAEGMLLPYCFAGRNDPTDCVPPEFNVCVLMVSILGPLPAHACVRSLPPDHSPFPLFHTRLPLPFICSH